MIISCLLKMIAIWPQCFGSDVFWCIMCRQIGILQFDVDTLLNTAFPYKMVPFIGNKLLKYSRAEINEMRQKKRDQMTTSGKQIESDDE